MNLWRIPFSAVAGLAFASVGAHFLERALRTKDEWAQAAFWMLATLCGMVTVMEMLQVWQHAGLTPERLGLGQPGER